MEKKLYFFGCGSEVGHYWFGANTRPHSIAADLGCATSLIEAIDNTFVPHTSKYYASQGEYQESIVGHIRIVSWADYTVDKRHGSNSNLVGVGYSNAQEMIEDAKIKFPRFMQRQPKLIPAESFKQLVDKV